VAVKNRWLVAGMGTLLQITLGTIYSWSYFQKLLVTKYGWSNSAAAWAFSISICMLGLSAAWGGVNLAKLGPRRLATLGSTLYGIGFLIGALALHLESLFLLYIGFGFVGGCGLGLGYVTPVATVAKWFPDMKGLATGMVVMGFGLGALVMSKVIAPVLMTATDGNLVHVFAISGIILFVVSFPAAWMLENPPAGYLPAGYTPPAASAGSAQQESVLPLAGYMLSRKYIMMWLIFFLNITAGIMFIGFQSPMLQDLLKLSSPEMDATALAAAGATLIAISSLFNGVGRFFWGSLSDKLGRINAFRLILGSQVLVFVLLLFINSPMIFGILVCYTLLCYGGGFGTMPSYVLDVFGAKVMPLVYGSILTAWSMAGIVGPQLAALIKDNFAENASRYTFGVGAIILACGFLIALFLDNKKFEAKR